MANIETLLLKTKLDRPVLVGQIVARQRLLDRLNASNHLPLILISAPAGYGKSVLISSYLETTHGPYAWLSLDEGENSIKQFMQYFLAAIRSMFPNSCPNTEAAIISPDFPPTDTLVRTVTEDVNNINQDFFLVLDDYSCIHNMEIHDLLSKILKYPPRPMHLIITTRHDPPLPTVTLNAKRQMAEIRVPDLRFNISEATVLVRSLLETDVDDRTIAGMLDQTEGWVTGLYLVAISHRNHDLHQIMNSQQQYYGSINEYLLNEVCSHIPDQIQDFLLRISILDRFCAQVCDAVNRDDNSTIPTVSGDQYMDWTKQANLFLIPLDDEGHWYQFHRLFRHFLLCQLGNRYSSEEIARFHSRASIWFSQNQLFEESLQHALAAGDIKSGIQVVARFNQKLKLPEQWQQLDRLVHSFSPQIIESSPDLLFAEACVMYARFQLGKMPHVLDQVEKLLVDSEIETSRKFNFQGEIAALRSYLYFWVGDYQSALTQGGKALAKLPESWRDIRELTKIQMADAMRMLGKESAYASLIDNWGKLYMNLSASPSAQLNEQMRLCFVHWMKADLQSLRATANNILSICEEGDFKTFNDTGHYFLGIADYCQNNLVQAERHFKAIYERKLFINPLFVIQSAFGLAMIYRAQGQINKAFEIINSTSAYLIEMKDTTLIPVIQAFQTELTISRNDPIVANQWVTEFNIRVLPPMMTFYYPHFTLLKILLAQDSEENRKQAADILSRLRYCVESSHNKIFLIQILIFEALLQKAIANLTSSLDKLKQALNLAKISNLIRFFVDIGPDMFELLQHLDERQDPFVRQICNSILDENSSVTQANSNLVVPLTDRELKIISLLVKRLTNKEIADQLFISSGTVKSHTIRIYQKLNVKSRRQAAEKALSLGIVTDRP